MRQIVKTSPNWKNSKKTTSKDKFVFYKAALMYYNNRW